MKSKQILFITVIQLKVIKKLNLYLTKTVKQFFRESNKTCICKPELPVCQCNNSPTFKLISKKPIIPDRMEIQFNPRARSAKMRIAERI